MGAVEVLVWGEQLNHILHELGIFMNISTKEKTGGFKKKQLYLFHFFGVGLTSMICD